MAVCDASPSFEIYAEVLLLYNSLSLSLSLSQVGTLSLSQVGTLSLSQVSTLSLSPSLFPLSTLLKQSLLKIIFLW